MARNHTTGGDRTPQADTVRVSRSPVAWALAVYFGLQSTSAYVIIGWLPQIYRDAGLSADQAGLLFAAPPLLGVPPGQGLSTGARRGRRQSPVAAPPAGLWGARCAGP